MGTQRAIYDLHKRPLKQTQSIYLAWTFDLDVLPQKAKSWIYVLFIFEAETDSTGSAELLYATVVQHCIFIGHQIGWSLVGLLFYLAFC